MVHFVNGLQTCCSHGGEMGVNTQRGGDRLCLESKLLHDLTHSDSNESFFPVFLSAPNQRDAEFWACVRSQIVELKRLVMLLQIHI